MDWRSKLLLRTTQDICVNKSEIHHSGRGQRRSYISESSFTFLQIFFSFLFPPPPESVSVSPLPFWFVVSTCFTFLSYCFSSFLCPSATPFLSGLLPHLHSSWLSLYLYALRIIGLPPLRVKDSKAKSGSQYMLYSSFPSFHKQVL